MISIFIVILSFCVILGVTAAQLVFLLFFSSIYVILGLWFHLFSKASHSKNKLIMISQRPLGQWQHLQAGGAPILSDHLGVTLFFTNLT